MGNSAMVRTDCFWDAIWLNYAPSIRIFQDFAHSGQRARGFYRTSIVLQSQVLPIRERTFGCVPLSQAGFSGKRSALLV